MSSSEVMVTITAHEVEFKDQEQMNLELFMHFSGKGWSFSHDEKTPNGTPLVVYFDKVLKFAGGESGKPTDYAQTYADWSEQTSSIISKYMTGGILVLQFVWEQERVTYHILKPNFVESLQPEEIFNYYLAAKGY